MYLQGKTQTVEASRLPCLCCSSSRACSIVCSQARTDPGLKEQDEWQSPKPSDKRIRRLSSYCCFKPIGTFQALTVKERGHGHTPGLRGDVWSHHHGMKAYEGGGCLSLLKGSPTKCLVLERGKKTLNKISDYFPLGKSGQWNSFQSMKTMHCISLKGRQEVCKETAAFSTLLTPNTALLDFCSASYWHPFPALTCLHLVEETLWEGWELCVGSSLFQEKDEVGEAIMGQITLLGQRPCID